MHRPPQRGRFGVLSLLSIAMAVPAIAALASSVAPASAADPPTTVVYDGIGPDVPSDVVSRGFQATQTSEFGDLVELAAGPRVLDSMTVEMDSFGCQTGAWDTNDCASAADATYTHPITLSIYGVSGSPGAETVGAKLAALTTTATVPFRPSADNVNCTAGDAGKWFDGTACRDGIAFPVTVQFPTEVVLPEQVIWTVAFDTSDFGKNPVGPTCEAGTNCAYDELNVGTDNLTSATAYVGTDVSAADAFVSSATATGYCAPPPATFGFLQLDKGCWSANRPMAQIVTKPQVQSSTAAYDAIGTGLPNDFSGVGFEATSTKEFGDLVDLAPGGRTLSSMSVEMVDRGCQSGTLDGDDCVTAMGATFQHPLTFNVYAVSGTDAAPTVGAKLASVTQDVTIPFRPSADPACTGSDAGKWLDGEVCRDGLAFTATLDFPGAVVLPDRVIWTIAYNTSSHGDAPIGATCVADTNCAYDALDVGAHSRGSDAAFSGTDVDPDGAFIAASDVARYCTAPATLDVLQSDTGCWAGLRPMAKIDTVTPTPPAAPLDFNPAGPRRVFDTRPGESLDALRSVPKDKLGTGSILEVKMTDLDGLVPATGVGAVSLNVTATEAPVDGFITVFPCGKQEFVSSLNFTPGKNVANAVIAPVSATGTVCFYASNPVHVIADVNGWFAAGRAFVPTAPKRIFDTRADSSPDAVVTVPKAKIQHGNFLTVQMTGLTGLTPATGVGTASLNVTVTNPESAGFITVYSCGSRDEVSSVNYVPGQTVANQVFAPVSADGKVCFYSSQTTDLVVDINGYLSTPSGFTGVSPKRVLDTRPTYTEPVLRTVPKVQIGGTNVLEVKVTDLPGAVPASGVSAVSLNVTAVDAGLDGYLTVYPCGSRPDSSSVNYSTGQTVANAVITPISASGTICFYSQNLTDLVVDVNGWFSDVPS